MCGDSAICPEGAWYQNIFVHRLLSDLLPFTGAGGQQPSRGVNSPDQPQVQNKLAKELPMCGISGSEDKFPLISCHTIREEKVFINSVHCAFSDGESGFIQAVSPPPLPHGLSDFRAATRALDNERFSEVGRLTKTLLLSHLYRKVKVSPACMADLKT